MSNAKPTPTSEVLTTSQSSARERIRSVENPNSRTILHVVAREGGADYATLEDATGLNNRWTRELVSELRENGLLATVGSPSTVVYPDSEIQNAALDVLDGDEVAQ